MTTLLLLLALFGLADALTRPPTKSAFVVDGNGNGQYDTIQSAVDAVAKLDGGEQVIFIQPGEYKEQVFIPKLSSKLTIYGYNEGKDYSTNKVTITHSLGYSDVGNDDGTGTLRVHTDNFAMYNVDVENTIGRQGRQALALSSVAKKNGRHAFYDCSFRGYQDTVLADARWNFFGHCLIVGGTDFIFNQDTSAWFEDCDIHSIAPANKFGTITASGRRTQQANTGIVLDGCEITGDNIASTELGRPWRENAWVKVQGCSMTNAVRSQGWISWNDDTPNTANAYLAEYGNCGKGAIGPRASFAKVAKGPTSIDTFLGQTSWLDDAYTPDGSSSKC